MMKRIALFVAIAFTTAASVRAQIPNFNSIEYKYGNGVMCEQCGRTNGHNSDCLIGKTQRLIRDYWAKSKTPESNKFLIKTYEENIRLLAKQGREARQAEKAQNKAEKKPKQTTSSISTSSSSVERTKLSFECTICKATFKASGVDEASHISANNPWFHKPTCPKYKPKP